MTEEFEQQIESQELILESEDHHLFDLAVCLIQYHKYALEVRSQGFFEAIPFDPPETRELFDFLMWCGNGFNVIDRNEHILGLVDIIRRNNTNIQELISEVRMYGATEQLAYEVNYVNAQMIAADVLLRLIEYG